MLTRNNARSLCCYQTVSLQGKNKQGGRINDFYYCLCKNSEHSLVQEATFKNCWQNEAVRLSLTLRSNISELEFPCIFFSLG